jgi:DNA-binding NtrC family response regulator
MAQMFLERFAREKKRRFCFLTKGAAAILETYPWPGNVRELQNTIERIVLLYDDVEITPEHLHFLSQDEARRPHSGEAVFDPESLRLPPDSLNLKNLEDAIIRKALKKFEGNKTRAADYLGITRSTLRSRLKTL